MGVVRERSFPVSAFASVTVYGLHYLYIVAMADAFFYDHCRVGHPMRMAKGGGELNRECRRKNAEWGIPE